MAERWEMGNKNRAVGETENEGGTATEEGELGGQGCDKGPWYIKLCSAAGWNLGRLELRLAQARLT